MAEYTCELCGKVFHRSPSRAKHGRGKHCSPECQYTAIRARPRKRQIEFTCLNCSKEFSRYRSWAQRKGSGKYCSRKCRDEHWVGENTPLYIDGKGVNWHGPNWQAQRRKALARDKATCQHCNMTKKESLDLFGQPLTVHHVRPFRYFDDYKKANHLRNLVTLCHSCHRIAEATLHNSA